MSSFGNSRLSPNSLAASMSPTQPSLTVTTPKGGQMLNDIQNGVQKIEKHLKFTDLAVKYMQKLVTKLVGSLTTLFPNGLTADAFLNFIASDNPIAQGLNQLFQTLEANFVNTQGIKDGYVNMGPILDAIDAFLDNALKQRHDYFKEMVDQGKEPVDMGYALPLSKEHDHKIRAYDVALIVNQTPILAQIFGDFVPPLFLLTMDDIVIGDTHPDHYAAVIKVSLPALDVSCLSALVLLTRVCNHMGRLLAMLPEDQQVAMLNLLPSSAKGEDNIEIMQGKTLSLILGELRESGVTKLTFNNLTDAIENNRFFPDLKAYAYAQSWQPMA
jgi:hypothetical protein